MLLRCSRTFSKSGQKRNWGTAIGGLHPGDQDINITHPQDQTAGAMLVTLEIDADVAMLDATCMMLNAELK